MRKLKYIGRNYYLYLLILPAFILFFIFRFMPVVYSIYGSVTKFRIGEEGAIFVGIQNYIKLFKDTVFLNSIRTTIFFTIVTLILVLIWSLMAALALNVDNIRLNTFFKVTVFLPYVTSWVVMGIVWKWFFNERYGFINVFLDTIGIKGLNWLGSVKFAIWSVIIVTIWKLTGLFMVIFLANLKTINPEFYEAAAVDGANIFQKFFFITIPQLRPAIGITTIMGTIFFFRAFTIIYAMTGGDPANSTNLLVFNIYRMAFHSMRFNEALAGTIMVLGFIFIIFSMELPILRGE